MRPRSEGVRRKAMSRSKRESDTKGRKRCCLVAMEIKKKQDWSQLVAKLWDVWKKEKSIIEQ